MSKVEANNGFDVQEDHFDEMFKNISLISLGDDIEDEFGLLSRDPAPMLMAIVEELERAEIR